MKLGILAACAAGLACMQPAVAQAPPVQHVVAVAKPAHYQGPCPAHIAFIGTIFVNYPSIVTYRWERSDRAVGPVESVTIHSGGQGVETAWQMGGAPGRVATVSETLHVLTPVDARSNPATATVACR